MFEITTQAALVTLGVALLIAVIRLVKGPTLPDRVVAASPMNEQSTTMRATCSGKDDRSRLRAFVRSRTTTRGSARTRS